MTTKNKKTTAPTETPSNGLNSERLERFTTEYTVSHVNENGSTVTVHFFDDLPNALKYSKELKEQGYNPCRLKKTIHNVSYVTTRAVVF